MKRQYWPSRSNLTGKLNSTSEDSCGLSVTKCDIYTIKTWVPKCPQRWKFLTKGYGQISIKTYSLLANYILFPSVSHWKTYLCNPHTSGKMFCQLSYAEDLVKITQCILHKTFNYCNFKYLRNNLTVHIKWI